MFPELDSSRSDCVNQHFGFAGAVCWLSGLSATKFLCDHVEDVSPRTPPYVRPKLSSSSKATSRLASTSRSSRTAAIRLDTISNLDTAWRSSRTRLPTRSTGTTGTHSVWADEPEEGSSTLAPRPLTRNVSSSRRGNLAPVSSCRRDSTNGKHRTASRNSRIGSTGSMIRPSRWLVSGTSGRETRRRSRA